MIYKFNYTEVVLEFTGNRGRAFLSANSDQEALAIVNRRFSSSREEKTQHLGDNQYLVVFQVSLGYRQHLLREIERVLKMLTDNTQYQSARCIDRYIVTSIKQLTGQPLWLAVDDIKEELRAMRKTAIVAREIGKIRDFFDWDVCIHNYVEINSKPGHKSRVVRNVKH